MARLKYFSENILKSLKSDVLENLGRYRTMGFDDLAEQNGWSMELSDVEVDLERLVHLDPSRDSATEVANSLHVFDALSGMTPALATEERLWSRLTHFECLAFSRKRWPIKDEPCGSADRDVAQIRTHYFAHGRTGCRDDNAISRLWWNAFIARRVDPHDPEGVLNELLRTADIRANLVERPMLSNRADLLRGIIRVMRTHPEVYGTEATFRAFMKALNLQGSGVLFESKSEAETDGILLKCKEVALLDTAT